MKAYEYYADVLTDGHLSIPEDLKCKLKSESQIRLGKLATIKKQYVVKHLGKLETLETNNIKSILEKMWKLFCLRRTTSDLAYTATVFSIC